VRIRGYAPATPCWSELASSDPDAAATFYSGLFGWRPEAAGVGTVVFTLGDLAAAGLAPASGPGQPSAWLTYISTEDIAATVESAVSAGGTVLHPPAEVGPRGQLAMVADPEGAVFALWQAGSFRGAQVANEPGAVCWSDMATRNIAGAAAFYGKVFGWVEQEGGLPTQFEYWEWSVNNRVVGGVSPMGDHYPAEVPAHWRTTFEVADCAEIVARCAELGGQVAFGPMEDPVVGRFAQLLDPQGGSFSVVELVPALRLTP
jgi:uncharacterized protein